MVVGGEDDVVGVSSELKNDGVGRAVDDEGLLGLPVEEEDVVEGIEVVGAQGTVTLAPLESAECIP